MKRKYIYEYHIETTEEGMLLVCSERNLKLEFSHSRDIAHAVSLLADQNGMPRLHSIAAQIDNACRQIIELLDELKAKEVES